MSGIWENGHNKKTATSNRRLSFTQIYNFYGHNCDLRLFKKGCIPDVIGGNQLQYTNKNDIGHMRHLEIKVTWSAK